MFEIFNIRDPFSFRLGGVAVRPIRTASGLCSRMYFQSPQAERWHSTMTMWEKWFFPP